MKYGLSLAEIAMSLVVVAILISAIAAGFSKIQDDRKVTVLLDRINQVRMAYAKIGGERKTIYLNDINRAVPPEILTADGSRISTPYGQMSAYDDANKFHISVAKVPYNACYALYKVDYGRSLYSIMHVHPDTGTYSSNRTGSACLARDDNRVILVFNK